MVAVLGRFGGLRHADGRLFMIGIAMWALGRGAVAAFWRDPPVVGPLKAEQLVCLAIAAVCLSAAGIATVRRQHAPPPPTKR